jgi:hypothetical protein
MTLQEARVAGVGDPIALRTKDNVIYMGDVVQYDRPSYAPPGHELVYGVDIRSAHRVRPGGVEAAPEEIPSDELPDEIDVPDGFHDGITTVFDFEGRYVLLEWAAALRPDSIRYTARDPVLVDSFVSDEVMTPESVYRTTERNRLEGRL